MLNSRALPSAIAEMSLKVALYKFIFPSAGWLLLVHKTSLRVSKVISSAIVNCAPPVDDIDSVSERSKCDFSSGWPLFTISDNG